MSHFASPVSRSVSPHDGARLGRAEDGRLGRRRSSHSPVCSPSWSPSSHPRWRIPRCCRCLSGTWRGRRRKAAEQMVRVNPCALLTMINDNMSSLPIVNYYYLCNWCRFIVYLTSELSLTLCDTEKMLWGNPAGVAAVNSITSPACQRLLRSWHKPVVTRPSGTITTGNTQWGCVFGETWL